MVETGMKLKILRLNAGMTQIEVARRLNVSSQAYGRYENSGDIPSTDMLKLICKFFNVSSDWLLGLENLDNIHAIDTFYDTDLIPVVDNLCFDVKLKGRLIQYISTAKTIAKYNLAVVNNSLNKKLQKTDILLINTKDQDLRVSDGNALYLCNNSEGIVLLCNDVTDLNIIGTVVGRITSSIT